MMTTVLRKHTKQYHHKSRFTRYLQYFRDVGLCYIVSTPTSGLCKVVVEDDDDDGFRHKWLVGGVG